MSPDRRGEGETLRAAIRAARGGNEMPYDPNCLACVDKRPHAESEWKLHPGEGRQGFHLPPAVKEQKPLSAAPAPQSPAEPKPPER
jgi:hypothetical protein